MGSGAQRRLLRAHLSKLRVNIILFRYLPTLLGMYASVYAQVGEWVRDGSARSETYRRICRRSVWIGDERCAVLDSQPGHGCIFIKVGKQPPQGQDSVYSLGRSVLW